MKFNLSPRIAVCVVACLGLFMFLGSRGLVEPDEGRFAEAAREMSLQSNWLVPHLAGVPHLQKPPVTFWLTAISIKVFGVNEWAARLPSALAALGIILLTMHLAGLLFGPTIPWKAGLILVSTILFFGVAGIITTDMLLSFWITGAVVSYVHYTRRFSVTALILFYICLGLGFLTKGPMAYMVPFSAVIPWAIATRHEKKPPGWLWHWIPGILFALAISASWFVVLFSHYPGLFDYYVKYEFIERIASNTHNRAKPFWYYSLVMFGGLLPWAVLLPRIIRDQWRQRRTRRTPTFWLLAGWLVIPWLVLHLVTSKLPTYILPLFPPMALVFAHEWERLQPRWSVEVRWISVLFAMVIAALPMTLWQIGKDYITPIAIPPLFIIFACVISMGWIALYILSTLQPRGSTLLIGLGSIMLASMVLVSAQSENVLESRGKSLRHVAEDIKRARIYFPEAKLFAINMKKFGLEFYLQEPIMRSVNSVESTLPIPDNVKDMFVEDALGYLLTNTQDEFIIVISRHFLPDPLPPGWTRILDYRNVVLVHRASDLSAAP